MCSVCNQLMCYEPSINFLDPFSWKYLVIPCSDLKPNVMRQGKTVLRRQDNYFCPWIFPSSGEMLTELGACKVVDAGKES